MQRDYDSSSALHGADLDDPASSAATPPPALWRGSTRAARKRRKLPILFDPRVSGSFLGHLSSRHLRRLDRARHLLPEGCLGQPFSRPASTIIDDPLRVRGRRSRPFDREGQPASAARFIEDGVLTSWILDTRSANQLGLKTTGHAGGHSAISTWRLARSRPTS